MGRVLEVIKDQEKHRHRVGCSPLVESPKGMYHGPHLPGSG